MLGHSFHPAGVVTLHCSVELEEVEENMGALG